MLTVGMHLADRYEILSKIGAGGMSDVYKAKDHILGRFVAIKVLKTEFSEDRGFVSKFRTEAQSAAGLEHPNIVNIYDVGSEEGLYYIVMEYVEGITLKTYIEKKGQLSFKEAVSIAIQVARGIEAAHSKQIIHRDIKPQNIIISTEGKVKVTDFGIAKAASSNTISSDVMGSVHYSSPEQARNGFVDGRSDLYSLGIVMYEMVTGHVPFDGDTTVAVAIQHLQEEMTPPGVYAEDLPVSLEKIILKCTQKNPDRRYQSIEELLDDLRKSLQNPDEDFVVITPLVDNGKTKVISEDELRQINEQRQIKDDREELPQESLARKTPDYEEDEEGEEEEDDGDLTPKMDKAVTIMAIVVAAIILIVIIYLLGSFFDLFHAGGKKPDDTESQTQTQTESESESIKPETVVVEDVRGKLQTEAEEILERQGLFMFVIATQKSDQPEGTVLEQNPAGGTSLEKGDTVEVIIAGTENADFNDNEDGELIPVPGVVGKAEKDAYDTLVAAGFKVGKSYKYDDTVPAGKVISQSPNGGSAPRDSTVNIVISQGQPSVEVPDVVGDTKENASSKLTAKGLAVSVKEEYNDTVPAGQVIRQSIAGGKQVQSGTTITITVSLGPETKSYSFNKTYNAPEYAVSAEYTLTGSDGTVYKNGSADVDGSLTVSAEDIACSSGTVTIVWTIEKIDEEGLSETSTVTKKYNVNFTKQ